MTPNTYRSAAELAADESFRRWVLSATDGNHHHIPTATTGSSMDTIWDEWLRQNPEQSTLVAEARHLVAALSIRQLPLNMEQQAGEAEQRVWQRIQVSTVAAKSADELRQRIAAEQPSDGRRSLQRSFQHSIQRSFQHVVGRPQWQYWAAASVAVLVCSLWYWWQTGPSEVQYATAFGETKSFVLPDGSEVALNANSTLSYRWDAASGSGQAREVRLRGEAFFHVSKQQSAGQPVKFIVRTDNAAVEVLGTQFNVNTRRNRTMVVLSEGKVRLSAVQAEQHTQQRIVPPAVELSPGEASEVSAQQRTLQKRRVRTELYSSWRNKQLLFEDMPLAEVAHLLKDTYNLDMTFADGELAGLLFTGNVPANNVDLLIQVIAEAFRLQVQHRGSTIVLKRSATP
jgi:ferric-dicitrate binding protein FerR (iron transport regulator)